MVVDGMLLVSDISEVVKSFKLVLRKRADPSLFIYILLVLIRYTDIVSLLVIFYPCTTTNSSHRVLSVWIAW